MTENQRGFTLMETLAALTVLCLFVTVIARMATGAVEAGVKTKAVSDAILITRNTLQTVLLATETPMEVDLKSCYKAAEHNGWTLEVHQTPSRFDDQFKRISIRLVCPDLDRTFELERVVKE
jgi:prepilin-type N-terminal cleavage/methylation domain-containing protein